MNRAKLETLLILLVFFEGDLDAIYEWLQDHFIYVGYEEFESHIEEVANGTE